MMVGLPESTVLDEVRTAKDLAKLKPKIMRIYPVLVLKGTELEQEYENGTYMPLSVEQAVERVKQLYYFFEKKKITVIRIGLQSTDTISDISKNENSEVVAGPYHETFRQLVESSINYDKIIDKIKSYNVKVKEIEIWTNPADVNNVVGFKKENIKKLKEVYDLDAKVRQDKKIKKGKLVVKIVKVYKDFLDDQECV